MAAEPDPAAVIALLDAASQDSALMAPAADAARATGHPATGHPATGHPGTDLAGDEVRRHLDALLAVIRAAVLGDPHALDAANRAADDGAFDRVEQGVSLPVLLEGVSAARAVVLEQCSSSGGPCSPTTCC